MYSSRLKNEKRKTKTDKKLNKLINNSDTDEEGSEHELSFYNSDRVKLMKEVLKIIKPKKMKSMAPDCMKNMEIEEINSMLLEELLGISNKRLKYIFEGKNLDEESSSSEDEEDKTVDIISLDDVSDDDFVIELDSDDDNVSKKHKHKKIKSEQKPKRIKKEKQDKSKKDKEKELVGEENLMSVLELLELQARARAIRSQLALEANKKDKEKAETSGKKEDITMDDEDDAVIIQEMKDEKIVITSSESESEEAAQTSMFQKEESQDRLSSKNKDGEATGSQKEDSQDATSSKDNSKIRTEENKSQKDATPTKNDNDSNKENVNVVLEDIPVPPLQEDSMTKVINENDPETENSIIEKDSEQILEKSANNAHKEGAFNEDKEASKNEDKNSQQILNTTQEVPVDSTVIDVSNKEKESDNEDKKGNRELGQISNTTHKIIDSPDKDIPNKEKKGDKDEEKDANKNEEKKVANQGSQQISHTIQEEPDKDAPTEKKEAIKDIEAISNAGATLKEEIPAKSEEDDKVKQLKEKRLRHMKGKLQSYKNEVGAESSGIKIIDSIVLKPEETEKNIQDDNDGIVINVDQDEYDCIICD